MSKKQLTKLAQYLVLKNMTQADFIRLYEAETNEELPRSTMSLYCSGTVEPQVGRAIIFASILECNVDEIFDNPLD